MKLKQVANMIYGAISLDTSTFIRYGLCLDNGVLAQLHQFKGKPYPLVLSDIVLGELKNHLKLKANEIKTNLDKSLKKMEHLTLNDSEFQRIKSTIENIDDTNTIADTRRKQFLNDTGAKVLSVDDVAIKDVFNRYFHRLPPFEDKGKKTKEFPDAAALLSLESWAKKNKTKILVVSGDSGWKEFGENSDYLDVKDAEDLAKAISSFLPSKDKEATIKICESLTIELNNQSSNMHSVIVDFLASEFDFYNPAVFADSIFSVESYDGVEVTINNFEVGEDTIVPVQQQQNVLVVEVELTVEITASSELFFSVYDSIDKDYIPMGGCSAETENEIELNVLLTFEGNLGNIKEVDLTQCSLISKLPNEIHFGFCEPNFYDE